MKYDKAKGVSRYDYYLLITIQHNLGISQQQEKITFIDTIDWHAIPKYNFIHYNWMGKGVF